MAVRRRRSAQPVQNGRSSRRHSDFRVGMQRIVIAGKTSGRLRQSRQIDHGIRRALRHRCGQARAAGPPKPPSPRSTDVDVRMHNKSPLALSITSRWENSSAPLPAPLSMVLVTRVRPTTVPAAVSGLE